MAKVLVTGASGFVGSHLAKALVARGDEVACLVRKTSVVERLESLGVRLAYGDVTEIESLRPAVADREIVYHVAGCTKALRVEQLFRVNEEGVRNVARACAERSTPPVLLCVSSLAAAGPAVEGRPLTEADLPRPISHYGRSKRAGELVAEEFADRVPTTVVRPPIVLGEADRQGLEMFQWIHRLGIHVVPGWGQNRFSVIHAADLAKGLILAAEQGRRLPSSRPNQASQPSSSGEGCYFVACEEHPTYADLGRMVAEALGRSRVRIVPTPKRAVWVVGAVNELIGRIRRQAMLVNLDKAREARAGSWLCSPQTAIDQLGFSPDAPLADRLRQTAQWYREHAWL